MPLPLPQKTTTASIQTEVSRLLQGVIPVLDALHTFPFHNSWLENSPGQEYLDLMRSLEKWLLWLWRQLQNNPPARVQQAVLFWESQQSRQPDGMLPRYYRFYEALAAWSQESAGDASKNGGWTGYIGFLLNQETHLLAQHRAGTASPPKEELELIAQQYLYQMQQVHNLDPYWVCLDFFILMGIFTQKSYFIPHLTFAPLPEESPPQFFDQLQNTQHWAEQASDYLDWLQNRPTPRMP